MQVATPAGTRRSYADQPVTLSGTATYLLDSAPASTLKPLTGKSVQIRADDRHTAVITTTPDSKGRFSVQLPGTPDTEWAVTLTGPANYLPGGGASVYVFSG